MYGIDNLNSGYGRKNITYKILGKKLIEREWYESSTRFFHYDNIMTVEKFDPKDFDYILFYIDENAANLNNNSSGGMNIMNGWFQPSEMGVLMLPADIGVYVKYDKVPAGKYSFSNNGINPEFFCQYFVKTDGIALHISTPSNLSLPSNIKYTAGFMVVGISITKY